MQHPDPDDCLFGDIWRPLHRRIERTDIHRKPDDDKEPHTNAADQASGDQHGRRQGQNENKDGGDDKVTVAQEFGREERLWRRRRLHEK